ncbi:MAG TPA: hypothetical protein VKW70_04200 [Terriglobia bacterium]|nr:hypothetical protein [Terriglobia bacterium]
MAESTELNGHSLPQTLAPEGVSAGRGVWRKLGLITSRSVFWTYPRGSWQYDVICAMILAFIFLTPASWFHDRPTLGLTNLRHSQGVIEVGRAKDGWHYLVDARLVASKAPRKPEDAIREILQQRLHKPVTLKSMDELRNQNNVVLGYTVVLTQ